MTAMFFAMNKALLAEIRVFQYYYYYCYYIERAYHLWLKTDTFSKSKINIRLIDKITLGVINFINYICIFFYHRKIAWLMFTLCSVDLWETIIYSMPSYGGVNVVTLLSLKLYLRLKAYFWIVILTHLLIDCKLVSHNSHTIVFTWLVLKR